MRLSALGLVAALMGSCQRGPAPRPPAAATPRPAIPTRVKLEEVEDRPPISLVARLGDPYPAVAVAVAHDFGSTASAALAALMEARVRLLGYGSAEGRPHHLGFQLHSLVDSPVAAAGFIKACATALRTPVADEGPEAKAVLDTVTALQSHTWGGPAETAVAACSGEVGVAPPQSGQRPALPDMADVERWRAAVFSTQTVTFAALGPAPVLEAATDGLRATEAWPKQPAVDDAWPAADHIGVDVSSNPTRRLSVALRVSSGTAAVQAAHVLARADSVLGARLSALRPEWSLTRVVSTTRPRGACLRIDLDGPDTTPAPRLSDVADVARVALDEAQLALGANQENGWTLEQSVLRPADPREAASVAAWRALSGRLDPGPLRRFVSYSGAQQTSDEQPLSAALRATSEAFARATLERRARVEPGQGELWALLASPCGNSDESKTTAGQGAMLVRALAEKIPFLDGVTIEPWVTADGIGLLAHGPPTDPYEQPADHAKRVGAALGRALVATRLSGNDVAHTRARLLEDVGPGPRPGFWLTLESVAPDRPSWLEPRGTWQALNDITSGGVARQQRGFIDGPLRLAVVANWSDEQVPGVVAGLQRWLRPQRTEQRQCAPVTRPRARTGRFDLETSEAAAGPSAFVAVPLPEGAAAVRRQAEWTLLLLNRRGGWLDQSLRVPGLVSSAQARLVGGNRAAALIIEIDALPASLDQAVAQVRALLARLAEGAAQQSDADLARAHFERMDRLVGLDPRHRIVHLWRGRSPASAVNLASLRRFHREVLKSDSHVAVVVKPRS